MIWLIVFICIIIVSIVPVIICFIQEELKLKRTQNKSEDFIKSMEDKKKK